MTTERERELAKLRQRRRRRRIREGLVIARVPCDDLALAAALAAEGRIDPMRDDDPKELERGLASVVMDWLRSKT
jgi:hypothetical protein